MSVVGTVYKVSDNSGAKTLLCLKNLSSKTSIVNVGDFIVGVVKSLKNKHCLKNLNIVYAVVIRTKKFVLDSTNNLICFKDNAVVLVNKKYTPLGTRIFGEVSYAVRLKGFLKIATLSECLI